MSARYTQQTKEEASVKEQTKRLSNTDKSPTNRTGRLARNQFNIAYPTSNISLYSSMGLLIFKSGYFSHPNVSVRTNITSWTVSIQLKSIVPCFDNCFFSLFFICPFKSTPGITKHFKTKGIVRSTLLAAINDTLKRTWSSAVDSPGRTEREALVKQFFFLVGLLWKEREREKNRVAFFPTWSTWERRWQQCAAAERLPVLKRIYTKTRQKERTTTCLFFSLSLAFFYDFYVIFFALWRVRSSPSPSRSCAGRIPSRILAHLEGLEARKIDFIDPFAK